MTKRKTKRKILGRFFIALPFLAVMVHTIIMDGLEGFFVILGVLIMIAMVVASFKLGHYLLDGEDV